MPLPADVPGWRVGPAWPGSGLGPAAARWPGSARPGGGPAWPGSGLGPMAARPDGGPDSSHSPVAVVLTKESARFQARSARSTPVPRSVEHVRRLDRPESGVRSFAPLLPLVYGKNPAGGARSRVSEEPSPRRWGTTPRVQGVGSLGSAGSPGAGVSSNLGPSRYQRSRVLPSATRYPARTAAVRSRVVVGAVRPVTRL